MFKTKNQKITHKDIKKDKSGRIVVTDTTETTIEISEILQQEEVLRTNREIALKQLEYIDTELAGIEEIKSKYINNGINEPTVI